MVRLTWRSLNAIAILFGVAIGFVSSVAPTSALAACGEFYRIQQGDTLRDVTLRSLGHDRYQVLFRANRDILPSPERLEIGQLIFVPCKGGAQTRRAALAKAGLTPTARDQSGDRAAEQTLAANVITVVKPSETSASEAQTTPEPTPETAQAETERPLRLLTASGMAPLAEYDLPEGGLLPVLIKRAFSAGGVSQRQEVSFVDDRKSHLSVLMPTGAFDLTFPWPGVDCRKAKKETAGKELCRDFLISRPIYEARVITLVSPDSPLVAATSPDALGNKHLCRPQGFPPTDIEGLQRDVEITIKRTLSECLSMVRAGDVDGVSIPAGQSTLVQWPGLVAAEGLTWMVPVHALAWRKSEGAAQVIAALDNGLERLQRSGRWFNTVSRYLHDVNARVASTGN